MDIALAGETVLQQTSEIQGSNNYLYKPANLIKAKIHNMSSKDKPTAQNEKTCHRCEAHHPLGECKFVRTACNYCKKKREVI